jgi:hypothetical protein
MPNHPRAIRVGLELLENDRTSRPTNSGGEIFPGRHAVAAKFLQFFSITNCFVFVFREKFGHG